MDKEGIIGAVIMLLCCWISAAVFLGIALWARKSEKPIHFWAGSRIDPKTVTDISAYNRENAKMWTWYSAPYWIAGLCSWLGRGADWAALIGVGLLVLACVPGIPLLVRRYKRIAEKYTRMEG